jgi:hypothetical protein
MWCSLVAVHTQTNWPHCESAERYRCQRGKDTDTFLHEQKYFGLVFQYLHMLSVGYYTFAFRAVCFYIHFQSCLSCLGPLFLSGIW